MSEWWQTFFDEDYLRLWEGRKADDETERQVAGLCSLLGLHEGSRVLDAPCGYGRISLALAKRGATVLGVDYSPVLLAEAERRRADAPELRLRYERRDLRAPVPEDGFDVALNIFSSLGYGTEADDVAVLSTLRSSIKPGGYVFIETAHRDRVALALSQNRRPAHRLPDGTLMIEEPRLDAISGRIETTWYWSGPGGSGQKSASLRIYTATELVRLIEQAGLKFRSLYDGCSATPFVSTGPETAWRLGILAVRE